MSSQGIRSRVFRIRLVGIVVAIVPLIRSQATADVPPRVDSSPASLAREAISSRLAMLHNITVECDVTRTYLPSDVTAANSEATMPGGATLKILTGSVESHESFRRIGTNWRLTYHLAAISENHSAMGSITAWDMVARKDRIEEVVFRKSRSSPPIGTIGGRSQLPWDSVDVAMGLRNYGGDQRMNMDERVKQMELDLSGHGTAILTERDARKIHKWTFSTEKGFVLTSYRVFNASDNTEVVAFESDGIRPAGGLMMPHHIVEEVYSPRTRFAQRVILHADFHVTSCAIGSPDNHEETYRLAFPAHSRVLDARINQEFRIGNRDTALDDATIAAEVARRKAAKDAELRDSERRLREMGSSPGANAPTTQR